ncbi:hypothetical protein E2C01_079671 [Portunus trituberculatus]|uniref:Uncharacterized protein n=1 Tax=Portunus trituberculatus TaxID=210409 RepID=A0A5B7IW85_PORTR|nr:hypothetical protein [Portunus trituberculatus]
MQRKYKQQQVFRSFLDNYSTQIVNEKDRITQKKALKVEEEEEKSFFASPNSSSPLPRLSQPLTLSPRAASGKEKALGRHNTLATKYPYSSSFYYFSSSYY